MKITRNNLEKSIVELIVEESIENIAKAKLKAIKHLQKNAEIKGFRKGSNIPENVVIKHFWEEHINRMAVDFSIDSLYKESLRKEWLIPVAQWEIKEIISENPLIIKIHIEVLPIVNIEDWYKKISLKKKEVVVTEEDINNAINDIEKKFSSFQEIEWNVIAELWDKVVIDTDWYENWILLDNTSMRDYPLILWSNILIPWFEEKIVWAKKDELLDFPISFPKDYHNVEFAWKETTFKVNVKKIEKVVKPEWNRDFIKSLRWKDLDLNWFKELIKEEIKDVKETNARMDEEKELVSELIKISHIDIWDNILKSHIDKVFSEIKQNMSNDNIKMSDYLESLKLDEETYKENHVKEVAIIRLKWELILHKLWELEKVSVTDEEMKSEIQKVLSKFENPEVLKRLEKLYLPETKYYSELRQRMIYRKIISGFFN